jgi:hypothetical protein
LEKIACGSAIFSRPYTVSAGKKRGFCRLRRKALAVMPALFCFYRFGVRLRLVLAGFPLQPTVS